jgi:hypothetical protein
MQTVSRAGPAGMSEQKQYLFSRSVLLDLLPEFIAPEIRQIQTGIGTDYPH